MKRSIWILLPLLSTSLFTFGAAGDAVSKSGLVVCGEAKTLADAAKKLNTTLNQGELSGTTGVAIEGFKLVNDGRLKFSAPTVQNMDATVAVCVTATR